MAEPQTPQHRMTAEEFMAWYEAQPDGRRYELLEGRIYPNEMQGERIIHGETKTRITERFRAEILQKKLPCQGIADGMAVRVDNETIYEPDAMVRCGPRLPGGTTIILDPVIVVEVVSPSSQRIDALTKLTYYFHNPHIMHYLIVIATNRQIIHHRRGEGSRINTSIHHSGIIEFDPPGLTLDAAGIFKDLE